MDVNTETRKTRKKSSIITCIQKYLTFLIFVVIIEYLFDFTIFKNLNFYLILF